MEIPEISSVISDFEAGVNCLQNPSMVSRFFTYRFWKWGALILAVVAAFSSLIIRLKLFLIRFRAVKPSADPHLQLFSDDFDFSDEDDDDEISSVSSLEDDNEDDELMTSSGGNEDFSVKGGDFYRWQNGKVSLRRRQSGGQRFSWSDFSTGKNIVKLWDSLCLGFDYEDSSKSIVSMWDFSQSPTVARLAAPSQSVVLSAKVDRENNDIVLGAYDTRMRQRKPAVYAKWGPPSVASEGVGIHADGAEKVYVTDDITGVLTVGDLRKLKAPLETVAKSDGDTWWDADAVIVEDEAN